MSQVFRLHLPHSQAHILAGALSSGGIPAAVAGDLSAHLYGGSAAIDCSVLVPEEHWEEAEAFLRSDFTGDPLDDNQPWETGPADGDPPGVCTILYACLWLAPAAALLPALLGGMRAFTEYKPTFASVMVSMLSVFLESLVVLAWSLPFYAVGAGLLLHIVRGYRRRWLVCRLMVAGVIAMLVVAGLLVTP